MDLLFTLRENDKDDKDILDGLVGYFRDIMVYKTSLNEKYIENSDYLALIKEKTKNISSDRVVSFLEILNDYSNRMKNSENSSFLMEMAILRLINLKNEEEILSRIKKLEESNTSNIVDIVNKLVNQKFENINLNRVIIKSDESFENKKLEKSINSEKEGKILESPKENTNFLEDDIKKEKEESFVENKIEDSNQRLDLDYTKEDFNLDKDQENLFVGEFSKNCSPILNALIKDEGFNYDIKNDLFTIYYANNLYYQFLEESKEKIKEILKAIVGKEFDIKVSSIDKKISNKNNNIERIKKNSDDVIKKLEEVFNNDLIIEE